MKTKVIIFLCILQFLFGSIVFCFSIIFSHKIAGPIYKLQKYLSAIRNGNGMGTLKFRNGDYFQELAEDYNTTLEKIQENYRNDFVYLNEVSSYLNQITHSVPEDKRQNIEKINERLMEIQNRFNNLY